MTNMCKTRVPADLQKRMDAVQNDKDAVKALGAEFGAEMSEGLLKGGAPGLHYYSLNLEVVVMGILERLGLKKKAADPKIIDLMKSHDPTGQPWRALEFFPPRTASGVENLKKV